MQQRRPPRFIVIGAGLSGILSAIRLEASGYRDVTIYEKADRLGGAWRENTYPGITDRFMRPTEFVGRAGTRLDEVWANRPSAYLSIAIPEFPNLFMLNGPNGPVGNFSLIEVAELQTN